MKRLIVLALSMAFATSVFAADPAKPAPKKRAQTRKAATAAPSAQVSAEMQQMKDSIAAQQSQIDELRNQVTQRDQALQETQQQLNELKSSAQQAQSTATQANTTAQSAQTAVADLKTNDAAFAQQIQENKKRVGIWTTSKKRLLNSQSSRSAVIFGCASGLSLAAAQSVSASRRIASASDIRSALQRESRAPAKTIGSPSSSALASSPGFLCRRGQAEVGQVRAATTNGLGSPRAPPPTTTRATATPTACANSMAKPPSATAGLSPAARCR